MRNKRIAITGHTGVLGLEFQTKYKNNKYLRCNIDIRNRNKILEWIKNNNFEILLHFAAIVPVNKVDKNKKKALDVNLKGTKNLVDGLLKFKKNQKLWFFFSSTSHVYNQTKNSIKINEKFKIKPRNYYGYSKRMAEKYIVKNLYKSDINYCIGRIFSFTHYRQDDSFFVPMIFKKILNKSLDKLYFKNVCHYRDFISVEDILRTINILYKNKKIGIFNIASGKKIKLSKIILIIKKLTKTRKEIIIKKAKRNLNLISDISAIRKLGFKPSISIEKIIKNFYNFKYKN